MSIERTDIEQALQILGRGTRLDVLGENAELLRYAESEITAQHSERRLRVRVKVNRDGRTAGGTLETLDRDAVQALADRLGAAFADLPAPANGESETAPSDPVPEFEQFVVEPARSIVDGDPDVRHQWFTTVRDGLDESARLGGAIRYDVLDRVVADSAGLFRSETLTKASIQAIAKQDGQSASVKLVHRDADLIPVAEIPGRLREALRPLPVREPFRGTCRVLLKPSAVNTLIATFGHWALGAEHYASGRSALAGRIGQQVVSEQLTLVDDATNEAGLLSGFDAEGNVRRRTTLIDRGVLTGVVSDRRRAELTGGVPTGHAVPDGSRFGGDPVPSHLLLDAGDTTDDELLTGCGSGLVVNRLDYLRVQHPKQTLVTGTTRDATYWAEDGKIVAWHPQLRFTFRMDEVLNSVLAVGAAREIGDQTFMDSVVVPALLIDAGPFVLT
ncbi:TldD/PmbA family protein [Kribbella sp. NPDC048928]|uniref:TldD/PmbA family protein n=1 Tax=Kribbella sp. NPDC048928 TaxID=3364111 RepID=UPI0037182EB3